MKETTVGDLFMVATRQSPGFWALQAIPKTSKGDGGFTAGQIFSLNRLYMLIEESVDVRQARKSMEEITGGVTVGPGHEKWPDVQAVLNEPATLQFQKIKLPFPDGMIGAHQINLLPFVDFEGFKEPEPAKEGGE